MSESSKTSGLRTLLRLGLGAVFLLLVLVVGGYGFSDGDGDGVNRFQDECPAGREDLDGVEDEDGCPEFD